MKRFILTLALVIGVASLSLAEQGRTTRTGASGSTIYGYLASIRSDNSEADYGFYEINTNGTYSRINVDTPYDGFKAICVFIRNGNLCAYMIKQVMFVQVKEVVYREYNLKTGALLTELPVPLTSSSKFNSLCYDPDSDACWGFSNFYVSSGEFIKIEMSNPTEPFKVATIGLNDFCQTVTYNAATHQLIGVPQESMDLIVIDQTTGKKSKRICIPDFDSPYQTGLCWSPVDNAYIWNAFKSPGSPYLVSLDPTTGECKELREFENSQRFSSFYCADPQIDEASPERPEILSNTFIGSPNNNGSITVKAPTKFNNGEEIKGAMTITSYVDDEPVETKEASAGAEVVFNFLNISNGKHGFSFIASADGHHSYKGHIELYVGADTPVAPLDVTLNGDGVSWSAVSEGVNGGYVNPDEVSYNVSIDGKTVAQNVSGTNYAYTFPEDVPLASHYAEVTATFSGLTSEATKSNYYVCGKSLNLDVQLTPTEEQAPLFLNAQKAANDNGSWNYYGGDYSSFFFYYNCENPNEKDLWLYLPPIDFPEGYEFSFSMWACNYYISYELDAKLEVKAGLAPTPDAMTETIIEPYTIEGEEADIANKFTLPKGGTYYIGVHGLPSGSASGIFVNNFSIKKEQQSGIGEVHKTNVTITTTSDGIVLRSDEAEQFMIVSPAGQIERMGIVKGELSIDLPAGVHIVKIATTRQKVLVK